MAKSRGILYIVLSSEYVSDRVLSSKKQKIGGWEEGKKEDMVLVRVYGQGTDMIIDREGEMKNMSRMQGIGLGGKLYAAFNNGICYEFLAGEVRPA